MKKLLPILLCCALLLGCGGNDPQNEDIAFESRYREETRITLSDSGVTAQGVNEDGVFSSRDIIYYADKTAYESGNPYGEGTQADMHTAREAADHIVVNITRPGTYRVSGALSLGQLRIDLGKDARKDPHGVVELILDNASITCTVAPAIVFLNVYECDGDRTEANATPDVDTAAAGANLILEGENRVSGSYVAKIYQDKDGEKKLWKQDGAIYSYMSMNVFGPGALALTAENEGLDTEMHLTIYGGTISIHSQNDGINTNEDGVSVTTIRGGKLYIAAGLGDEGDGIDSNGYLVIHGGTVVSAAKPVSDSGLDSDLGSYIHGGTVIALGATMNWAESDSRQVTMNLQFAQLQAPGSAIVIRDSQGEVVFSYDPAEAGFSGEYDRGFQGAVISAPGLREGETYRVYLGDVPMGYTGSDLNMGGHRPGRPPEDGKPPQGEKPAPPNGEAPPPGENPGGQGNPDFYMQDRVNAFTGIVPLS